MFDCFHGSSGITKRSKLCSYETGTQRVNMLELYAYFVWDHMSIN